MTKHQLRWWRDNRRHLIRLTCYWLSFFLLAVVHWLYKNFGPVTIPQLLYYFHFSDGLTTTAEGAYLVTFCLECLLAPTMAAALVIAVALYLNTQHAARSMRTAIQVTRASNQVVQAVVLLRRALPFCVLILSTGFLLWSFSAFGYMTSMFWPDRFASRYIEPRGVPLQATHPKNLVIIYVESLEASYSDHDIFGEDLLKEANAIPGSSFESYVGLPGTNWTIAALVATQCGVPLQFVLGEAALVDERRTESFLPHAVCLGDLLKELGYRNVFMGGADLRFSAKNKFLASHSYQEMYGSVEWRRARIAQSYSDWGLYDDDLLRAAKTKLLELAASGQPFNLTLLTVDTHQPYGYYSQLCKTAGAVQFEDILKCTSRQLADFIDFSLQHDLLRTTNFIIVGDHLSNPNPLYSQLLRDPHRRIFNKFIAAELPPKNRETIVPFDLFPSTLEFIGIEVQGDRLGLGCSAFFTTSRPCAPWKSSEAWLGQLQSSKAYATLWSSH